MKKILFIMILFVGCSKDPHLVNASFENKDCKCECTTEIQDKDSKIFIPSYQNK